MEQTQISLIFTILFLITLLIWGRWRYDFIAMVTLMLAVLLKIIPANQAFVGFSHPATITIALILIISHSLIKSGAVDKLMLIVNPFTKFTISHIGIIVLLGGLLSMFMNNIGALAILMPIAVESAYRNNRHPATLLMPLSFASILGGMTTLIGTPPNIIIANYRQEIAHQAFNMFDFTPVGGSIAIIGCIFITLFSKYFLPKKKSLQKNSTDQFHIEKYIFEVQITEDSKLIGKTFKELEEIIKNLEIIIVSYIHKNHRHTIPSPAQELELNNILIIEGNHQEIDKFVTKYKLNFLSEDNTINEILHSNSTETIEVVISPNSALEGRSIANIDFQLNYQLNLLAISRQGTRHRGRIKSFNLKAGDVLLLHGKTEQLNEIIPNLGCLPLAKRGLSFGRHQYAMATMAIFICTIISIAWLKAPLVIALTIAVILLIVSKSISIKEIYNTIEWPIITLLASLIPLGKALESTNTTQLFAEALIAFTHGFPNVVVLCIILVVTMSISDILNNAATTILMLPIVNEISIQTGTNIEPYLMVVSIGASCAFLTPIGHQNNALIMGPGEYKFTDYWRLGLPLEILICCTSIPLIMYFWPLT